MDALIDAHNRRINYLRISVTDRCNLRCQYCMPKEGVSQFGHSEILTYEEILRIAELAVKKGINKVRITGGEPLVRKDAVQLISQLSRLRGIEDLSMTTNGILLAEFAPALIQAGLKRVNISMDSLLPEKYRQITRGGELSRVWAGIKAARAVGISPIKINVVAIAGFNDLEILNFARLTMQDPFQVRFIEFMPIGFFSEWRPEQCLPSEEIKRRIETHHPLVPVNSSKNSHDGPARLFKFPGAVGEIGFISPISDHFCNTCNRLRLTADGKLKTCLFSDEEVDIKFLLRSGCHDEELEKKLSEAISTKPLRHGFTGSGIKRCHRPMVKIGG
ncbi:MAG: GTP 3',8-cyclase MoaA [Deltaproteobacteria bacterium]|jgi:cyclic pyranopterin phosphate synthase|nr:GTP 3',8-cyclase MoaA [Deltaproteobacteria bacterium]